MLGNGCNVHLPLMVDPINQALSNLSQESALTRGLIRYVNQKQIKTCPLCGREQFDHILAMYRDMGISDCEECNRACVTLRKVVPPLPDPIERRIQANLLGGIHRFGLKHHIIPAAPILVTWELTTRCNMGTCMHCHIGAGKGEGLDSELSFLEAKEVVNQLADWGVEGIAFTGGESLLWPDFLDLVTHATNRGICCYMATNGLLLTERTIKELKNAGLCLIHISLDGHNARSHDHFRGCPGSFEKVMKAIKGCHSEGIQVALAATPTRLNVSEMVGILRLSEDLQVDWFVTYNYLPSGRGTADLDLDTGQKDELWSNLFEEARHCSKTRWLSFAPQLSVFGKILGGKTSLSPTHYYEPIFTEDYQTMLKASTACMAGRYYLGIKADGRVVPCIFLPEEVGNVRDQKLADLWNRSPILINLRDRDKIKGICRDCAYGASCGGCRARARAYTGDYMASDPQCPVPERLALYTKAVHGADLKGYSHK